MAALMRGKRAGLLVLAAALATMLALGVTLGVTQRGDAPGAAGCTESATGGARAEHAELAADCDALLASRDALAGAGALNWSTDTALAEWDGVTVSGEPSRVTGLDLRARGLAGAIPAQLASLTALTALALSGNALTGCIPNALWSVADKDLPDVELPDCTLPMAKGTGDSVLGSGTYNIVGLTFDVPSGGRIVLPYIEIPTCAEDQGEYCPSTVVVIRDVESESSLFLDADNGMEFARRIRAQGDAGVRANDLFDRIANSARPSP